MEKSSLQKENQQERLFDLGWFIGALESEGGFSLVKSCRNNRGYRYTPLISITNTDGNFINFCIKVLKDYNIPHYVYKASKARSSLGKRLITDIIIRGYQRCDKALKIILPLLKVKYKQANALKEFIDYRNGKNYRYPYGEYEDTIHLKMKELNKNPQRLIR